LVDTERTQPSDSDEEDIVPRETGFFSRFFVVGMVENRISKYCSDNECHIPNNKIPHPPDSVQPGEVSDDASDVKIDIFLHVLLLVYIGKVPKEDSVSEF
jgi:hypothetical protein